MCPLRLARDFRSAEGTKDFFSRWRVRDPLLAALEEAHLDFGSPTTDQLALVDRVRGLRTEEIIVLLGAAAGYCEFFRARPAVSVAPELADAGSIRLGGAIDLVVATADGGVELRQLELWRRPVCANPLESWEIGLAAYRLGRWLEARTLRIIHLDPLSGVADEYDFTPSRLEVLRAHLNGRTKALLERMRSEEPEPGRHCTTCGYLPNCRAVAKAT